MKNVYLLPCSCGLKCEVDPGQAGSQVTCSCGQVLKVPSIRALKQLEIAPASHQSTKLPAWSPLRGVVFSAGLLAAVAAALFSGYHGYWFFITTKMQDPIAIQLEQDYEHVDRLTPVEAMQVFRQQELEGLGRHDPPYWVELDRQHDSSRRWGIIGLVVTGAGLLAAAGSTMGRSKRAE